MTTIHEDDVTGEQYREEWHMEEFGLVFFGDLYSSLDVHTNTIHEDPESVREEMHEMVDEAFDDWEDRLRDQEKGDDTKAAEPEDSHD